jgi:pyridoxal 5'-phosphate synthase pdxS subunit
MIRTKGEAGTGNVVEAVRHARTVNGAIRRCRTWTRTSCSPLPRTARALSAGEADGGIGRLPVVNFAAGGVATPADAALMMQLGVDGVFVGSGIFKSGNPEKRARAIVMAVTHYNDPQILAEVSEDLGEPMVGINIDTLGEAEKMAARGLVEK